jgi:hypothetical protein
MSHFTRIGIVIFLLSGISMQVRAQKDDKKKKVTLTGDMGVWYEGYGLSKSPENSVPNFYQPRKPWNSLRYAFNPSISYGKWTIPFNFNFSMLQNNFITPITSGKQSVWQFLTNPANNFGISPKIGTTEILLGTQTLHYSDLSTGDVGIFGYGFNLSPGKFRIKFFNGVSQRPIDYLAPNIAGAFQRNHIMGQVGLEKEGKYFVGFNIVRAADKVNSITSFPLPPINPQENVVLTFLADATTNNGWTYHLELGQSYHTTNLFTPPSTLIVPDFKPFLKAYTSTNKDNAVMLAVTKKGSDWEIGGKFNYYGAGYFTAGYPFMTNDRMEYLANTRFNAIKKKVNVVASLGQRFGNLSKVSGPNITKQLIANINVFTQFTDKLSLNTSFNNFGFNSADVSGYKSVSNELSINPSYTWTTTTMSNLISATYTWSKYDETIILPASFTQNNTQTVLLLYVPTFFKSKISPDFSIMWFKNSAPSIDLTLFTASGGMNWKLNDKITLKGQLQYNLSNTAPFTANKNLLATAGYDWTLYKKLTWQMLLTGNLYKYGTELPGSALVPLYSGYPGYLESSIRTGLQYKF